MAYVTYFTERVEIQLKIHSLNRQVIEKIKYGSVECGSRKAEGISQRVISYRFFLI